MKAKIFGLFFLFLIFVFFIQAVVFSLSFFTLINNKILEIPGLKAIQKDIYFKGHRILWQQNLTPTPIDTKGFQTVLNLVDNICNDSFDLFFGLYYYNKHASSQLQNIREALSRVERQLAAREAYISAINDANDDQRKTILDECRLLMREAMAEMTETIKK